jgi:hypothetical protein
MLYLAELLVKELLIFLSCCISIFDNYCIVTYSTEIGTGISDGSFSFKEPNFAALRD